MPAEPRAPARSVEDHYRHHLAPIYLWMAGGFEAALSRGETELDAALPDRRGGSAVDLGAGFGMHAIPLARRGWSVLALDSSAALIGELRQQAGALPVRAVEDDLLGFQRYLDSPADLILCIGDTLTHLPDLPTVDALLARIAESVAPGGTFVTSFRDYTVPLAGLARFIPVRSDRDRILDCFLEYEADHVLVHDLIHERDGGTWSLEAGAYRKVRLAPGWVQARLVARGFDVRTEPGLAGMVRLVGTRA